MLISFQIVNGSLTGGKEAEGEEDDIGGVGERKSKKEKRERQRGKEGEK